PYKPLQLDWTVGQQIVHSCGEQQQADQVSLASVGKLTEADVVQQIVGQLDLPAGALELAKIAKAETFLHDGLLLRLDGVDLHDRDRRLTVGFEVDSAELRNRGVINRTSARTLQDFDATTVRPPCCGHRRKHR